jgi:hypothetical protein
VSRLRGLIYWLGLRPRPGTIFFSPSLDLVLKAKS